METPRAKPLFVIGTARSGTTWLANMLVSHPALAGVTAPEHQGIHESHLFSHTRYVLTGQRTCQQFLGWYRREDYWKLLELDSLEICESEELLDVYSFFRLLMEKFSASKGARYWLEKTPKHAIYYQDLLSHFPDAIFVIIERNFEKTLLSNLNKYARPGASRWRQIMEKVFRYTSDMRAISQLKLYAQGRFVSVAYEDLTRNTDFELSRILDFLKVAKIPLESAFPPDSSFKDGIPNRFVLHPLEMLLIRGINSFLAFVPLRIMFWLRKRRDLSEAKIFPKFEIFKDREIVES